MSAQRSRLARINERKFNHSKLGSKYKSRRSKSRRGGIAQVFRGILLEGMGALALVFLYLTVQVSQEKMNAATTGWEQSSRSLSQQRLVNQQQNLGGNVSAVPAHRFNQPLPIGKPVWSTWNTQSGN